jgi:hypothetical protein
MERLSTPPSSTASTVIDMSRTSSESTFVHPSRRCSNDKALPPLPNVVRRRSSLDFRNEKREGGRNEAKGGKKETDEKRTKGKKDAKEGSDGDEEDDENTVNWEKDDPENPRNWPSTSSFLFTFR